MTNLLATAKKELEDMKYASVGKNYRTGDIRKLSAKLFKDVKDKPIEIVFSVCEELLEQLSWPLGIIAFDFAYRMKNQYDEKTFTVFEGWLERYVRGWGDCDDFCTHAFGELISQNTKLAENIIVWTKRDEFWMRRAAAVVLLPSIGKNKYNETNPLRISDILMKDEHHLVLKGYGWMLKTLSTKEPELVFEYLMKNKTVMPRVAYRYALEKMDSSKKKILMQS
ncbi:MAG: DNA alkylation repair protein [Bacteroidales bacterium]|jgi:3-methyladenine DNA glycosylase AlkD|nr:DNA alkylation repair protein [Bacteroidales bacterium]